jgi:hypothetical protein
MLDYTDPIFWTIVVLSVVAILVAIVVYFGSRSDRSNRSNERTYKPEPSRGQSAWPGSAGGSQANVNTVSAGEFAMLRHKVNDLVDKVDRLEARLGRESLPAAPPATRVEGPLGGYRMPDWPIERGSGRKDRPLFERDPSEEISKAFNAGIDRLKMQFPALEVMGLANMNERSAREGVKPLFQASQAGDYYLIRAGGQFYAVPKSDSGFGRAEFISAAMGEVFNCNYKPGHRYRKVQVKKPVSLQQLGDGSWEMKEKGTLELSEGEEEDR